MKILTLKCPYTNMFVIGDIKMIFLSENPIFKTINLQQTSLLSQKPERNRIVCDVTKCRAIRKKTYKTAF